MRQFHINLNTETEAIYIDITGRTATIPSNKYHIHLRAIGIHVTLKLHKEIS